MMEPLRSPARTIALSVRGDFAGLTWTVPAWTSLPAVLKTNASAPKNADRFFSSAAGTGLPPSAHDSTCQVPWNRCSSSLTACPFAGSWARPAAAAKTTPSVRAACHLIGVLPGRLTQTAMIHRVHTGQILEDRADGRL